MAARKRANPRVREHIDNLRNAGLDTQKFFDALTHIRDDSALSKTHLEALKKLIAAESFIWYMEALRDEPIDRVKLREEALKIAQEHEAAIVAEQAGGKAAQLLEKDIGAGAPTEKDGADDRAQDGGQNQPGRKRPTPRKPK